MNNSVTFLNKLAEIREKYSESKKKNFLIGLIIGILGLGLVIILGFFTFGKLSNFNFSFDILSYLKHTHLSNIDPGKEKINILLTGRGGGYHEGPDLTDTIILASLNTKNKTVSLLSIPRDLYVEYLAGGEGKINELYMKGLKTLSPQKSMSYLKEKVQEITGEGIDYYLNIDFDGFTKFIDVIGGVQVNIPEDLNDNEFPDNNWGYITFSIKKGLQTLDGDTALKYVRSRHSTSDFDRSIRQQLVMKAVKDKLFSLNFITSPTKIKSLFYTISSNIKTDMTINDIIYLALTVKDLPNKNILSFNLNDSCFQGFSFCNRGGFLYTPQRALFGGASVLLPSLASVGDLSQYSDISKFVNIIYNYPEVFLENYEINIVNSTKVSGLAERYALELKKFGFNIPDKKSIWSTKEKHEKSQVYFTWDESQNYGINPKSKTLEALSILMFGEQIPTKQSMYSKNPGIKIEIVLGDDYKLFMQ